MGPRKTRKVLRKNHRGGDVQKPKPLCQCVDVNTGKGCTQEATRNTLFCQEHRNCPKPPLSGYEPVYEPEKWNKDPAVTKSHNCYNFFANYINTQSVENCRNKKLKGCRQYFAQPGALNGDRDSLDAVKRRVCPTLEKLMFKDIPDLKKTTLYEKCPAGTSKGAMVNDEFVDFHYFTQNKHGMYTHKDGSNKAKDIDSLGRRIFNPEQASRDYRWQGSDLNYDKFCGFYCVPRNHEVRLGQGGFSSLRLTRKQRREVEALRQQKSQRTSRRVARQL